MKITKMPKRLAEPVAEVQQLLKKVSDAPDDELPDILDGIIEWCWPRGDLHFWAPVLNRFDTILEETCRDYDLSKLQINEFTPLRKRLVVSILNFSRLLIENSTSRKLYNSFEHLNSLLFARDTDVLEATLRLLLRFAQQSSTQQPRQELQPSQERLATIAVTWAPREHSIDSVEFAKGDTTLPADVSQVRFQFYRHRRPSDVTARVTWAQAQEGSALEDGANVSTPVRPRPRDRTASSTPQTGNSNLAAAVPTANLTPLATAEEGLTTVDLGNVSVMSKDPMDILADAVEANNIPPEDQFELFQKIRLAKAISDPAKRRQLLVCRLLAIACYAHMTNESTATTQLFLYEPDVVHRTAALVKPEHNLPQAIVASALYALDALGRYRSKINEVLGSLSASVNHGVLMQVLRHIIDKLATGHPTMADQQLIDAFYGLVSFVTSTSIGSGLVVGAGLVQLMVELLDKAKPETYTVQRSMTRAVGLLDSVFYAHMPAFNWFCQAHGVDVFVRRIEGQVNEDIELVNNEMQDDAKSLADGPHGRLTFGRAHLLKGFLQSISHMMISTGTAEGLRNLIDTSLLLSIKKVMENRRVFGPQNLALCINIMATFVHNEPTSLGVIQEKKLPETFMKFVKEDIEPFFELINAIPNAVGALCLNQAGLDMFTSESIVPKLLGLLTSELHVKVLSDQDNVTIFGGSIDELIRHQPTMKQSVIDGTIDVLRRIQTAGSSFVPDTTPEDVSSYTLAKATDESKELARLNESARIIALADVISESTDFYRNDPPKDVNIVGQYLDVTARFLEIFFQSTSHCKDFLKADGLTHLLSFYDLPCLSYNFASSTAADSVVHLLRYMSEISPNVVVHALLSQVKKSFDETRHLWREDVAELPLITLLYPITDEELAERNDAFRQLIRLNARMQLLADVSPTFTYNGSKTSNVFLQLFSATPDQRDEDSVTVSELAYLQRSWMWQSILFRAAAPASIKKESDDDAGKSQTKHDVTSETSVPADPSGALSQGGKLDKIEEESQRTLRRDDPVMKNATAVRYLVSQIKSALSAFLGETNRLLSSRRAHDHTYKRLASSTAGKFGENLCELLAWRPHEDTTLSCAFATDAISQTLKYLYEERSNNAGYAQALVLAPFLRKGGLQVLITDCKHLLSELAIHFDAEGRPNKSSNLDSAVRLGHTCNGLRTCLDLFLKLVWSKALLETPNLSLVVSKEGVNRSSPDYFEPHEALIAIRSEILPLVNDIWNKSWLEHLPFGLNRALLQIMLLILEAEGEGKPAKKDAQASGSDTLLGQRSLNELTGMPAPASGTSFGQYNMSRFGTDARTRHSPLQPDESRITQLMDMGFERRAARHALVRCANNLSAAAEYLLMTQMAGEEADALSSEADLTNEAETQTTNEQQQQDQGHNGAQNGDEEESAGEGGEGVSNGDASGQVDNNALGESGNVSGTDAQRRDDTEMTDEDAVETQETKPDTAENAAKRAEDEAKMQNGKDEAQLQSMIDQLNNLRAQIMPNLVQRALHLADTYENLVFHVKSAVQLASASFTKNGTLIALFEEIREKASIALGTAEKPISVRLHLLALILNDTTVTIKLSPEKAKQFMTALTALMNASKADGKRPLWLASLLLVLAAVIRAEYDIESVKIEEKSAPETEGTVRVGDATLFDSEVTDLLEYCMLRLDHIDALNTDDSLALYRFLVILTRRSGLASLFAERDGLSKLLRPFSGTDLKKTKGCRSYAAMVVRHVVEANPLVLRSVMTQEIVNWFRLQRVKTIDTTSLSRGLTHAMLRDPNMFLDIVTKDLKLKMFDYSVGKVQGYIVNLSENKTDGQAVSTKVEETKPSQQPFIAPQLERDGADDSMDMTSTSPSKPSAQESTDAKGKAHGPAGDAVTQTDGAMHFLLSELVRSSRFIQAKRVVSESGSASQSQQQTMDIDSSDNKTEEAKLQDGRHLYVCFLLQLLTELLSSYLSCKTTFLHFTKKRMLGSVPALASQTSKKDVTPMKAKSAPSILNVFLFELIPMGFVTSREHEDMRRSMSISNWAMSAIVALCADVAAPTGNSNVQKEMYGEVTHARKVVLDALSKSIRDATVAGVQNNPQRPREPVEARYGRLYALSDLTYRLLKARPHASTSNAQPYGSNRPWDDSTLHQAKTMLERNFVTSLTCALADVDLNLPMVKPLLERILKPLEYLTKVAIKMNRAERKGEKRRDSLHHEDQGDEVSVDDSLDEDDMDEDDHEDMEAADMHREDGREETPDFYRNSSLGMHTGDMEAYDEEDDDDEDEDEDMDDEMHPPMGFDEEGTDDSDEDSDDDVEEHIVEVMDEDEDDEDETDSDDDSSLDDDEDHDGEEGSWIDEDDSDDSDGSDDEDDDEVLDFVLEGDPEHAHELFEQAGHIFQAHVDGEEAGEMMAAPIDLGDVDEDDDDEGDEMEEDSEGSVLEEVFEDGLQPLGLLDPIESLNHAPVDRFGATWGWTTNVPSNANSRPTDGGQAAGQASDQIISPFAFMRQRPATSRHSRSRRLMDWDHDPLADVAHAGGSRYITTSGPFAGGIPAAGGVGAAAGDSDVASHPLLRQDAQPDDAGSASRAQRAHRSTARRRGLDHSHFGDGRQGLARSLDELMSGGAIQFLETLLSHGAGTQNEPIRISMTADNGVHQVSIGGRDVLNGPLRQEPRLRETDENGATSASGDGQRQAEESLDVVTVVQDFTPSSTSTRWNDAARIVHGPLLSERSTALRSYLINALRPNYFVEQEELKRQKVENDEAKRNADEELARRRREKGKLERELKEAQAELEEATRSVQQAEQQQASSSSAAEQVPAIAEAQTGGSEDQPALRTDGDTDMNEGARTTEESQAQQPNLELASLQQRLDELDPSTAALRANATATEAPAQNDASHVQHDGATETTTAEQPRERVTTMINGSEIDITDSGIDPTFLEALPEDMREEVLNQHFRERRAAAAASSVAGTNLQPTNIAPEFLDALPPELRAEVIQQEAIENHRRRVDEARRQGGRRQDGDGGADNNDGGEAPPEIDPASFLATLNSDLRSAVLMDQDPSFLETLPPNMRAEMDEVRRMQGRHIDMRRLHRRFDATGMPIAAGDANRSGAANGASSRAGGASSGNTGNASGATHGDASKSNDSAAARDVIQLVDKAGLTALVRLMFFPQMDAQQSGLRNVLINLSGNAKTRHDLLNMLLIMLAEGTSSDAHAVAKTYMSLSDRVNRQAQTPTRPTMHRNQTTPTTATSVASPLSAAPRNAGDAGHASNAIMPISRTGDEAPFLIASRSIEMLSYLASANEQAAHYFLREDPHNAALTKWLKRNVPSTSSSKGKERAATSNAPINVLLILLGKASILANAQLVDSLIALLNTVTRPLPSIAANLQKKKEEAELKAKEESDRKAKEEADKSDQTAGSGGEKTMANAQADDTVQNIAGSLANTGDQAALGSLATSQDAASLSSSLPTSMPQIGEDRMASLVKPLSTGISSKGFQNTLAVASNLSSLDGARDVITSALQHEAKMAGQTLLKELDDLLESLPAATVPRDDDEHIHAGEQANGSGLTHANTNEEGVQHQQDASASVQAMRINSPAFTDLASPSSSQTVILRSLRALEWIMTRPKTGSQTSSGSSSNRHGGHHHHHHHHHHGNPYANGTTVRMW